MIKAGLDDLGISQARQGTPSKGDIKVHNLPFAGIFALIHLATGQTGPFVTVAVMEKL